MGDVFRNYRCAEDRMVFSAVEWQMALKLCCDKIGRRPPGNPYDGIYSFPHRIQFPRSMLAVAPEGYNWDFVPAPSVGGVRTYDIRLIRGPNIIVHIEELIVPPAAMAVTSLFTKRGELSETTAIARAHQSGVLSEFLPGIVPCERYGQDRRQSGDYGQIQVDFYVQDGSPNLWYGEAKVYPELAFPVRQLRFNHHLHRIEQGRAGPVIGMSYTKKHRLRLIEVDFEEDGAAVVVREMTRQIHFA